MVPGKSKLIFSQLVTSFQQVKNIDMIWQHPKKTLQKSIEKAKLAKPSEMHPTPQKNHRNPGKPIEIRKPESKRPQNKKFNEIHRKNRRTNKENPSKIKNLSKKQELFVLLFLRNNKQKKRKTAEPLKGSSIQTPHECHRTE